jgi:hypothetical protein
VSSDPRRQLVSTAVIGIAVCLGGSFVFVGPARRQLAQATLRAAALNTQLREAEAARDSLAQYTVALNRVSDESAAITRSGAMARDERQLFSALMASAAAHHLRIDQLNPAKAAPVALAPGAAGAPQGGEKDVAVGYSMTAIGTYGELASFLRSLRSEFGFSTVRTVRLVPTTDDQRQTVRALIETSHFAFDPSPVAADDASRISQAGGH